MSSSTTPKDATLVITPVAILSYPHVDAPQKANQPGQKDKYSAVFVFEDGTDLSEMKAAAQAAAAAKWGDKIPPAVVMVGGKGATFRTDVEGKYKAPAKVYVSARSETQPGLAYRHAAPGTNKPALVEPEKIRELFYPGLKVKGLLRAFAYDKAGNKGIGWALNGIQIWEQGDRLDNRTPVDEAFTADLSETPADLKGLI